MALVVAYRRQRLSEGVEVREDTKLFTERFGAASAQLGHDKAPVRLAGVYALGRLADDWLDEQQTCIDVLCAYLRMPASQESLEREEEEHVRSSAVQVIAEHLRYTGKSSWTFRNFDFSGAAFNAADFSNCTFLGERVSFANAKFSGRVSFSGCVFNVDTAVSFEGALFAGEVGYDGVAFYETGANFRGAKFDRGSVSFMGCTLQGQFDFSGAYFQGSTVQFYRCVSDWSESNENDDEILNKSTSLSFIATRFQDGELAFHSMVLDGADIAFTDADFRGGWIRFHNIRFDSGDLLLLESEFYGTNIQLSRCDFNGAHVDFSASTFAGGTISVDRPGEVKVRPVFDDPVISAPGVLLVHPSLGINLEVRRPDQTP